MKLSRIQYYQNLYHNPLIVVTLFFIFIIIYLIYNNLLQMGNINNNQPIQKQFQQSITIQQNQLQIILQNTKGNCLILTKNFNQQQFPLLTKIDFTPISQLYLGYNNISFNKLIEQLQLSHLKKIFLNNNNIKDLQFLKKLNLQEITVLDLSNNHIQNVQTLSMLSYPKLQRLTLKFNRIQQIIQLKFKLLKQLNLSNNLLENIQFISRGQYPQLRLLYLQNNKIISIQYLSRTLLPSLQLLKLSENPIQTIEGINRFEAPKLLDLNLGQFIRRNTNSNIFDVEPLTRFHFQNIKQFSINIYTQHLDNFLKMDLRKEIHVKLYFCSQKPSKHTQYARERAKTIFKIIEKKCQLSYTISYQ